MPRTGKANQAPRVAVIEDTDHPRAWEHSQELSMRICGGSGRLSYAARLIFLWRHFKSS